jgi:hypothetical protein
MAVSPWTRRALFGIAVLAIPLPYQVVEGGRVPAAWLATVAVMVVTSALRQGGEISATIAQWFAIQAAIALVLAYVAARLVGAGLRRLVAPERRWAAVAAIAAGAFGIALLPIFSTTAVRGGAPTNLPGVFGLP